LTVLVAGAGPAGARLAQRLASKGVSVILVERLVDAQQDAFSSAVVPIQALADLCIPVESISARWHGWQLFDPEGTKYQWWSQHDLGAVLDFGTLRQQLWQRAIEEGVEFLRGWRVKSVLSFPDWADVELLGPDGTVQTRRVSWVVDATGHSRFLLGSSLPSKAFRADMVLDGFGVEWILQGDKQNTDFWRDRVSFFMGSQWVPYGYGWIFPMAGDQLKVGICRLPPPLKRGLEPLGSLLKRLLVRNQLDGLSVLDRHGGVIRSSIRRSEAHVKGRVVGVGDAVSTANLLGGEGIRHALVSADVLAPLLIEVCSQPLDASDRKNKKALLHFERRLSRRLGWRWNLSGRLAKRTWWGLYDQKGDRRLGSLINALSESANAEDLSRLLFDYRFERYGFRFLPYLMGWR
jgi:flavin-dependent dehydrogenase